MKKSKSLKNKCKCGHRSTGYSDNKFNREKISEGEQIEYEHTCNKKLAREIAKDHISEMGYEYYPELKKLEEKLIKQSKNKEFLPDKRKTTRKCNK